jgi:gentisate 1,2-dioxygenase
MQSLTPDAATRLQPAPRASEVDDLEDGLYYEYSEAADPLGSGVISRVPCAEFLAHLHQSGGTAVVSLDLSHALGCAGPATSPGLSASFIHILPHELVAVAPNASSQVYFVMRGKGSTRFGGLGFSWSPGDLFSLPAGSEAVHEATEDAALYWVHDEPMMRYLGAKALTATFRPTLYPSDRARAELAKAEADPEAQRRSRVSILLANRACATTRTVTPSLWAMLGILPAGNVQGAHRHQSVALDLIIDCQPGCYTLVATETDPSGALVQPTRVDWHAQSVFVTPPGYWHSHHNESGAPAYLLPIQDAGLHTFLRSLDIRFR